MSGRWGSIRGAFIESTALELDVLGRALALCPLDATGIVRIRVDLGLVDIAGGEQVWGHVSLGPADNIGASPEGCVELLGIRPLLFGTAWKVLDLFMDALMEDNQVPTNGHGRYSIAAKVTRAKSGQLAQDLLQQGTWDAVRQGVCRH